MILTDLVNELDQCSLYETVRTKLHGTYVKYKNGNVVGTTTIAPKWYYCEISFNDDSVNQEEWYFGGEYDSPESATWITLFRQGEKAIKLRSLSGIDSEPVWPTAGYYWAEGSWFKVSYVNQASYKAGLGTKTLKIANHNGDSVGGGGVPDLLDACDNHSYPTLLEASGYLLTTPFRVIPISHTLTVAPHPYVDGPVLHWEDHPVGLVQGNRVLLNKSSAPLIEYLEHMEIEYANVV